MHDVQFSANLLLMQFSKFENHMHFCNAFCVVSHLFLAPSLLGCSRRQSKNLGLKGMVTTSGHTIHLMPGDHKYDTPNIPIVVVWNGINFYSPTYPTSPENVMKWKLTLVNKHLTEAIGIFGEVEGELDDNEDMDLCEQFHSLRDTAVRAQTLLKGSGIGQVVIPQSNMGHDPRDIQTSLTRCTSLA